MSLWSLLEATINTYKQLTSRNKDINIKVLICIFTVQVKKYLFILLFVFIYYFYLFSSVNAKVLNISKIAPKDNIEFIHHRIYIPERLYVDNQDNLYVVNGSDDQVHKINSNGVWVTSYGSKGTNELNAPMGIAINGDGYVYITNTEYNNYNIARFTSSGVFVEYIGSTGSGDGQFNYPAGIAIDSNNNIFIADSGNNRIQKLIALVFG